MMLLAAFQAVGTNAPNGAALGIFASMWCCGGVFLLAHFVMFLVALIQILSRNMPSVDKLLWAAICWFLPTIGPILWWVIGIKQHPAGPRQPPGGPPATF